MNSKERRKYIHNILINSNEPTKGGVLAEKLNVTRQVIVKDIAILRAEGINIIATPEGYIVPSSKDNSYRRIIAVCHESEDILAELNIILKFGGVIEDVIVEHSVYGEIKGMLMIKNLYDMEKFIQKIKKDKAEPLLKLTGGVHLHTIVTDSEENMNRILRELKENKFLISDI